MRQYTTPEQTAKLIELGLADSIREERYKRGSLPKNYSIGELIEMLPTKIEEFDNVKILQITSFNGQWRVKYAGAPDAVLMLGEELIDALYYMILELKAEGVI